MPIPNQDMITAAFVQQFHDSYEIATQQKESRFQGAVHDRGSITGSSFTVNDMGALEMQDATRFGNTVWTIPEAGTRNVIMADKTLAVPVWKGDLHRLIANPQGTYMQQCINAGNRQKDRVVYRALLDPVLRKTEENGAYTSVALPATQKIADGGTPVTKSKLIFAKSLFRKNECDEENGEELYIAYDSNMLIQILGDTTLTSADFMAVKMLQEGALSNKWLGFNWIPYEALDETAGVRSTVAWCKTAVHFGTGSGFSTDIGPRRDKQGTIQIQVDASYGAGRANEKKVVQVDFKV